MMNNTMLRIVLRSLFSPCLAAAFSGPVYANCHRSCFDVHPNLPIKDANFEQLWCRRINLVGIKLQPVAITQGPTIATVGSAGGISNETSIGDANITNPLFMRGPEVSSVAVNFTSGSGAAWYPVFTDTGTSGKASRLNRSRLITATLRRLPGKAAIAGGVKATACLVKAQ